jgi:hypothetical protein
MLEIDPVDSPVAVAITFIGFLCFVIRMTFARRSLVISIRRFLPVGVPVLAARNALQKAVSDENL